MGGGFGISLLVPFRSNPGDHGYEERIRNFEWTKAYWHDQLPLAEFVHGHDESYPYSKTRAVNDAARRAHGDVVVILDADAYFPADVLETAAREIRIARQRGHKLWFVPYRRFYRLDRDISTLICWSDPWNPLVLPDPPPKRYAEELPTYSNSDVRAHWYGALVQCMPREAFDEVGGMDERFAGWGSEDVAFMRAVDTLYAPHKTLPRAVCHLFHPRVGATVKDRKWAGQETANTNWPLSSQYLNAKGDPKRMREVVEGGRPKALPRVLGTPAGGGGNGGGGGSHAGPRIAYGLPEAERGGAGSGGAGSRLPGEPAGLPVESVREASGYYSGSLVSTPEALTEYYVVPPLPSIADVQARQRAGRTGGRRPVGRVKAIVRDVKDIATWLWSWYVVPVLERFGWNKRNENSPGDDAK